MLQDAMTAQQRMAEIFKDQTVQKIVMHKLINGTLIKFQGEQDVNFNAKIG